MEENYGARNSTTAKRLREIMDERGVRQIDIVNATGIKSGRIAGYLKGDCTPKSDRIAILAKYFDVSEAWLWGFDAPKERSAKQKRSDQIADLVVRVRSDEKFSDVVFRLAALDDAKLDLISQLLSTFGENTK